MRFSVLIPVYKSETPEYFDLALKSMHNQTFQDFEVVLVIDGPIPPALEDIVEKWTHIWQNRFKIVRNPKNLGIAGALNAGLKECSEEMVVRMDSDDYSLPDRLQIQHDFLLKHPEVDILGANIGEFEHDINKIFMIRNVPEKHNEIINIMWFKCPMNHVTIVFKKSAVLAVGGYDASYGNDDFLWVKMRYAGFKFYNQQDILVHVRVGNDMAEMVKRRATLELFKWNCKIRTYMFKHKMMNFFQYIASMSIAVMIYILPLSLKCYLFKKSRITLQDTKIEVML